MTQSLLTGAIRTKFSVTGATMRRRHAETKQSLNTNFAAVCPAIHLRVRATAAKAEFGILPFSEVSVGPPVSRVNPRLHRSTSANEIASSLLIGQNRVPSRRALNASRRSRIRSSRCVRRAPQIVGPKPDNQDRMSRSRSIAAMTDTVSGFATPNETGF